MARLSPASGMMPVRLQLDRYDAARAAAFDFVKAHPADAAVLAARKSADSSRYGDCKAPLPCAYFPCW